MSKTPVAPDTHASTGDHDDEAASLRKIARAHSLKPEGLAELVAESRIRARRNRRRVPDSRLDDLVRDIGAHR